MYLNDPRGKRKVPLRQSLLFNKAKHSEDWHQTIDAVAGVLHPSDSKFPYPVLRQATDAYLKKKGKITQTDADIRLAILIDAHESRDVAVAAAAHAMAATSLRALLHVDLNIAYGSYWGLSTWLQCLIAANYGNPASITDLEATWARRLLPFATHGPEAAGKILIGVCRALRECATPSMNAVPEFLILVSRALTDYAAHLEGLRLRNSWIAAHGATCWMAELGRTSSATTPPGFLLPEHILDAQFPIWRVWARWRPDLRLIKVLSSLDRNSTAVLSDLLALEGPDFISGRMYTLREGLIEQYSADRSIVRLGQVLVQVPSQTRDGLREILDSAMSTLESIWAATETTDRPSVFRLFIKLTIARPMTKEALNLVQAVLYVMKRATGGLRPNIIDSVLRIYTENGDIGGSHIHELQVLLRLFEQEYASSLRRMLCTPLLMKGITRCFQDGQAAVRTLIEQGKPWTELACELHTFCSVLRTSKSIPIVGEKTIEQMCLLLPSTEHATIAIDIYNSAHSHRVGLIVEPSQENGSIRGVKSTNRSDQRVAAPSYLMGQITDSKHPLEEAVEQFFSHRLLSQQAASYVSQRTFDSVLRVWEGNYAPKLTQDRRLLAVLVAKIVNDDTNLRIRCLNGIASASEQLAPGLSIGSLLVILQGIEESPEHKIVKLMRLLASCPVAQDYKAQLLCWRDLAYHLLAQETHLDVFKDRNLVDHTLANMKAAEWLTFLTDVQSVFATGPTLPSDEDALPPILRAELQKWGSKLAPYASTLTRLEGALGDKNDAVRCILSHSGTRGSNLLAILQLLKCAEAKPMEPFLHKLVSLLSTRAKNDSEVLDCVSILLNASSETVKVCHKIWDAKHGYLDIPGFSVRDQSPASGKDICLRGSTGLMPRGPVTAPTVSTSAPINPTATRVDVPASVVEVMVAGWLLDKKAAKDIRDAVLSITCLLDIEQLDINISKAKLTEATTFWQKVEDDIIREADRLLSLQKALKARDPPGTTLLLQQVGVPDTSELDEEILKLPAGVVDAVERISDNEVEITFSLVAFSQLHRTAMGIPGLAETLHVQLCLDHSTQAPPAFCLHYNTDAHFETLAHTRYSCSPESDYPTKQMCTATQTAFTWQLSRIIYSKLRRGVTGIADIYQHITTWLPALCQFCVSCSTRHNIQATQLRRSTPCDVFSCARLWYNLPLHVRIPEIRTDTFAIDVALTSVYAAAMTGKPELLPNCPIRGTEVVKSILNALPSMSVMRDAVDLSSVLKSYCPQAETLISWAVVHHRGFLATATGLLKIPNLPPGTHQFVLANASPSLESASVSKIGKRETTVLFHGTSLDRLPAILAQGLRVCSGTSLQRTGAAHGKGIYLSDDPATSFYYSPASLSWKNSGLSNMKMLLGCEVVGSGNRVSGNIHVVKEQDAASVMVRYVLLFTREARVPIRGHIEPAMASGMKALRSGAV